MLLEDRPPSDALIEWAEKIGIVKKAKDRPWFYSNPPVYLSESYRPICSCKANMIMNRYPCEDNGGYVYVGQCPRCEKIVWSVLECAGK